MMISKTLTDLFIVILALSFLIFSVVKFSWKWLNITWIKLALLFFLVANISACFSLMIETSLLNGLAWIRFPLFAAAISVWLVKDKEIFYFTLMMNFFSLIVIFVIMSLEVSLTDHHVFEWPFRNPLNGPFIHRIGVLFFCISFLIVFLESKYKKLASLFIFLSIFFSLLSGHRAGTFIFVIIIVILAFWPKLKIKRFLVLASFLFVSLIFFFLFNLDKLDRYFFDIYNFTNTSLIQYIGLWKTGLIVFFENPLLGIGPTNVQNYLTENLIVNYDPFENNEHPHNHYIQAFAETGLVGGILYISMFLFIIIKCYKNINKNSSVKNLIHQGAFMTSICIFWPFANNYDLFGQQQNAYLWYVISLILSIRYTTDKV